MQECSEIAWNKVQTELYKKKLNIFKYTFKEKWLCNSYQWISIAKFKQ